MGLFGGKKNAFDHKEDGVVAIVPPLAPARVPVDDGEGGLTLGFRDEKAREAALKECSEGVIGRCIAGAAGGCAVSAARECERTVPRPKSRNNPLTFVRGAFRSKEEKGKELEEAEKSYREAREACERERRERCSAEARAACEGHAEAFCVAVIRGRGKGGALYEGDESIDDDEEDEEEDQEKQEVSGKGEGGSKR